MRLHPRTLSLVLLAALATFPTCPPLAADDRDLLRESQDDPYVFILFDVSGSMNWQPAGDAWAPGSADDPNSKFYQAKSGLYRVLSAADDFNFGFATFNQDEIEIRLKHYLYQLEAGQAELPWIASASALLNWPMTGEPLTFGSSSNVDSDSTLSQCGQGPNLFQTGNPLLEARGEMNRYPKTGNRAAGTTTTIWFRHRVSGTTYPFRMEYSIDSGLLGDNSITVDMRLRRYSTGCGSVQYDSGVVTRTFVRFYAADNNGTAFPDGTNGFLMWERDPDVGPSGEPAGFYDYTTVNHDELAGTCNGWDGNGDVSADTNSGFNVRQDYSGLGDVNDPVPGRPCSGCLDRGDVIPLEWEEDAWLDLSVPARVRYLNRDLILTRLAPNLLDPSLGGQGLGATPDFRQAPYLSHNPTSGRLTLLDTDLRPLIAAGSTPIGASMSNFRTWFGNWRNIAAAQDPRFGCKKVTLLILTDGDETCNGNPANQANLLFGQDVETYVVGFGLPTGGGNTLVATTCAGRGTPGAPCTNSPTNDHLFLPNNENELVAALESALASIRETASTFASAAAPTLQANIEDKVVISSFTPLNGQPVWAGRLDAYLKPVPTDNGRPDRDKVCGPDDTAECLLWDAGDSQEDVPGGSDYTPRGLLLQAPLESEVDLDDAATLDLGLAADQRRVFYSQFETGLPGSSIWVSAPGAGNRQLLTFPTTTQNKRDLFDGMGIAFIPGDTASEDAAFDEAKQVIGETLWEKEGQITDPLTSVTTDITYLLGDIFHSNPVVVDQPADFQYYTSDPYVGRRLCNQDPNPSRAPSVSYKWFADRHICRRKMLFVGSNDGQLHAFDAGIFQGDDCKLPTTDDRDGDGQPDGDGDPLNGAFDNGTGREIFSFVPRVTLPHLRYLAQNDRQDWGLDNTLRVEDVFIDPNASTAGTVTCLDREWRTVAIGSYREGGSGYFALDITQPDTFDSDNVPQPVNIYVPSCIDGPAGCDNRPFPYVLWEFYDSVPGNLEARMDEDLNNLPDLAETWSVPAVTRIRTCDDSCTDASIEDRFVAVFGGGLGESGPTQPTGNFVYMVDVETGQVLWKEPVAGAVPGDVVPVTGGDGYLKYLYFGTTDGYVYKSIFDSGPMRIADVTVQTRIAGVNTDVTTQRLVGPVGDTDRYDPFQVFTTNGKSIYHELAVVYVQQRNGYALAFGTGNRWNLWDFQGSVEGRFYVFLDTGFVDTDRDGVMDPACVGVGCTQPLAEGAYHELAPDNNPGDLTNYLIDAADPTPGWWLRLGANERVITEAFALSGVTIFTSFLPDEIENPDGTCSRTGQSHIFIVGTLSGAGYWFPDPDNSSIRSRYFTSEYFHSAPFVERGATGNLTPPSGGSNADQLTESLALVREELKRLFPANCRFGNFTQNVKTLRQDTNIVFIAPVPICIEPTNFKEF
jgi:Tfp pilus tip-associated adhesin PilY1